jgi:S-adenosylmethionine-dependent methyltransferase
MTIKNASERFQGGAPDYAAYLETPEGRLRLDLTFANLLDFLPTVPQSLRALDLGCGTGALAVRLAQLGVHVTLLDSSLPMLDLARQAVEEAGVADLIELKQGDATQLANLFHPGSFDLILCHNLLEYVEDPDAIFRAAERVLRDSSSILSLLVRSQAGEVLKAAIRNGDLGAAERNLTAEWGEESLYGGTVRLFTSDSLQSMLMAASSLTVIAQRGVRVMSDYLPPQVSPISQYQRILELERKLGSRPEFAAIARYSHLLARRTGMEAEAVHE